MDNDFEGRIVLITGAAQGLGFSIAQQLGARGATLAMVDINNDTLQEAADALRKQDISIAEFSCDVTDDASVANLRNQVVDRFGKLHVLINNVGYYKAIGIRDISGDEFDRVVAINLKSVFLTTQAFMDLMIETGPGRIVSVASNDAYVPKVTNAHYAAAKAGVVSLTKTFAAELAPHGILVNGVSPGAIATETAKSQGWLEKRIPMIPLGRGAEPGDIASVIAFLASGENRFMTGETVIANGGFLMV